MGDVDNYDDYLEVIMNMDLENLYNIFDWMTIETQKVITRMDLVTNAVNTINQILEKYISEE